MNGKIGIDALALPAEARRRLGDAFKRALDVFNIQLAGSLRAYREQINEEWDAEKLDAIEDKMRWFDGMPGRGDPRLLALWANMAFVQWRNLGDDSITLDLRGSYDGLRVFASWYAFRQLRSEIEEKTEQTKRLLKNGKEEQGLD